jgi:predicted TPR repeat methyltransferase
MKNTETESQLADAYNKALELEKAGNHIAAAKLYARVLEIDPDDCGGAAVRLAAMGLGETPQRAPEAYVEMLFDQHADVFDDILVDQLGYHVPLLVRQVLDQEKPGPYKRLLDLGCGTGLSGVALADITSHRTGIDLSSRIINVAAEHDIYDDLYVGDAVAFVEEVDDEDWDLVVATDMLPYLGDVSALLAGVARISTPGAVFALSTEVLPDEAMKERDFLVGPHQRFVHKLGYIETSLKSAGFTMFHASDITVRHEEGVPQPGHLVLAEKV